MNMLVRAFLLSFFFLLFFFFSVFPILPLPLLLSPVYPLSRGTKTDLGDLIDYYEAPFGLAAEYAHPLETLILGMGTIGGPLLMGVLTGNVHLVTVYLWIVCRLFQAIDSHSGYDFPLSLRHILPFWAGADHHDHHHQAFIGCYASSFRWWDYLCDTEGTYHAARENQKEMRNLMAQGMDRAQAKKIAFKRQ